MRSALLGEKLYCLQWHNASLILRPKSTRFPSKRPAGLAQLVGFLSCNMLWGNLRLILDSRPTNAFTQNVDAKRIHPDFEIKADISPNQGYQWPHKKNLSPPIFFLKKEEISPLIPLWMRYRVEVILSGQILVSSPPSQSSTQVMSFLQASNHCSQYVLQTGASRM